MYIVAFAIAYALFRYQCKHGGDVEMSAEETQDIFIFTILFLLLFARVFSCLFYSDTHYYLTHPWMMFWPFRNGKFVGLPGMSYHGGVVGTVIGGLIVTRRHKRDFLQLADIAVAAIPLGYTFGRLGNFLNAELYGRVTASPLGMIFPGAERFSSTLPWVQELADKVGIPYIQGAMVNLPRHPSQLYEAFFEGVVLFLILWFIVRPMKRRKGLPHGIVFACYLFGYGFFRFLIEYCRQPDADIGYVISFGEGSENIALFTSFLNISKGQVFCLVMMLLGLTLGLFVFWRREHECNRENRKAQGTAEGRGN